MGFTSLAYFIDLEWLHEACRRTRKDGAVGVDGQTASEYAEDLESNLQSLLNRAKSGSYQAPPVRRVNIPKGKGETRPIGIPTFEDKVLQRAVAMVLEAVYEQDFLDCSYGFRPGCSAHQALETLRDQTMAMKGSWVVELDIQKFFDHLDHAHLREFLRRRIRDGVLQRLIGKWLKAGVIEKGSWTKSSGGTPQGGVISPILSNIYLHYVLDEWFVKEVQPRMRGQAYLVRYADDAVMGFELERDADRVLEVLHKRFARFGLKLHPQKTRKVKFIRPPWTDPPKGSGHKRTNGSFAFLGFTHYWGRSRKGNWVVKRKTASINMSRAVRAIHRWCRFNRHADISQQHNTLRKKLRGHYAYYGITGNWHSLRSFYRTVRRTWKKWLGRRSQRGYLTWPQYERLLQRYSLPEPVAIHSTYRS
jgi:group II intron reverse transcriptase/maturase